jgi:ankyrin repeat protein
MMLAAAGGFQNVVEYLLNNGAKLDLKDNAGKTAFHYATKNSKINMAKFLLE